MYKFNVIVIGAGSTGLYLSRKLAEQGLSVLLLEKKKHIGENIVCAGVVSKRAFEEYNLSSDSILLSLREMRVVSPRGASILYRHPDIFAHIVDRSIFNQKLAEGAVQAGVTLLSSNEVTKIIIENNHVQVKALENYSAALAIITTGVSYRLNKCCGLGVPSKYFKGAQTDISFNAKLLPSLLVGNKVAPGSFAWALPLPNNIARIGLITESNPRLYIQQLLKRMFNEKEIQYNTDAKIHYKPIAHGIVSPTYNEKIIAVGEAAGQVKTTTGGGIYFGFLCADIACKVIAKCFANNNFSASGLREYEQLWHKALRNEIINGYYIRKVCSRLSDERLERLFDIIRSDGIIPLVQTQGDFDWHALLLKMVMNRFSLHRFFARQQSKDVT